MEIRVVFQMCEEGNIKIALDELGKGLFTRLPAWLSRSGALFILFGRKSALHQPGQPSRPPPECAMQTTFTGISLASPVCATWVRQRTVKEVGDDRGLSQKYLVVIEEVISFTYSSCGG